MDRIPSIRYSIRRKNAYRGTLTWFGYIHEQGERPYAFSLHTDSEEEARRWLDKQRKIYDLYRMDLADGIEPSREPLRRCNVVKRTGDDFSIAKAVSSYLVHCASIRNLRESTVETYNRLFDSLARFCKARGVSRVPQLDQALAQDHILSENWSAASQKLATNLYCNWFNYLKELHGLSQRNPWSLLGRPKVDPKDKVIWTAEQMDAILDNAPDDETRAYWAVLRFCGCRNSETAKLLWGDWNRADNTITVRADDAKGRKSRFLYITVQLQPYLEKWAQRAVSVKKNDMPEDSPMFPGLPKDESHRNRVFRRVLDRLGLQGHLHSFRDSWITHALEQGMDAYTVAKLAGHSDPSTTLKWYARLSSEHMRGAVQNIKL